MRHEKFGSRPAAAGLQLQRALAWLIGPSHDVQLVKERNWSSATFCGTWHSFVITLQSVDARIVASSLQHNLPEHEFDLDGHFVAEIGVKETEYIGGGSPLPTANRSTVKLSVEALSVENH